jgi:predicted Zn-ribbon and HTH transcriptional regulator
MTFLEKIKERMSNVKNAARIVLMEEIVDDETQASRLALCNACDSLFTPTMQCKKCGCFVNVKASFARSNCPAGKWLAITSDKD